MGYGDRRRDTRFAIVADVRLRGPGIDQRAQTADLSCSGLRVAFAAGESRQPSNGPIHVDIGRPDGSVLELFALPARHSWQGLGLRFVLADELDRLSLAELIDDYLRAEAA